MTKPRLTHEQHIELGRELHELRNRVQQLGVEVSNAFPLSGREGRPGRKLLAAAEALDTARSDLENLMLADHPAADVGVYYPGATARP